jgi:hypothetical protein
MLMMHKHWVSFLFVDYIIGVDSIGIWHLLKIFYSGWPHWPQHLLGAGS